MSHWTNSAPQLLGTSSGQVTFLNYNVTIVGGNQTIVTGGTHQYAYTINLFKPSGEAGPTRVAAGLFVNRNGGLDFKLPSVSKAEIDSGAKEMLGNTGEIVLLAGDQIQIGVWADEAQPGAIITSPFQCTLTIRRVVGLGT